MISESFILNELDIAFKSLLNSYGLINEELTKKKLFFLDLEHPYCSTAGSRLLLFRDNNRWALVMEKVGYFNREYEIGMELFSIGNCVIYDKADTNKESEISNYIYKSLVPSENLDSIEDADIKDCGLVKFDANKIKFRDSILFFDNSIASYSKAGIAPRHFSNPKNLFDFEALTRLLISNNPKILVSNELEYRSQLPKDLPLIMVIDNFHFKSSYDVENLPSKQETYQLIAKILSTGDCSLWKPKDVPNNHWKNWESGHL